MKRSSFACLPNVRHQQCGMSLLEILAVAAIVMVLMLITAGGLGGFQRGILLREAGGSVQDFLSVARLEAIANNRPMEVRFVRREGETDYRYILLMRREPDGTLVQQSRVLQLPQTVVFSPDTGLSTLLQRMSPGNDPAPVPALGQHSYRFFRFQTDGSTDLPQVASGQQGHFISVVAERDRDGTPANFVAIQVEPLTGRVFSHRP